MKALPRALVLVGICVGFVLTARKLNPPTWLVIGFGFVMVTFYTYWSRLQSYKQRHKPLTRNISSHILAMQDAAQHNPFVNCSAIELAAMIRNGKATSEQIVEAHIQHIERANPHLNAVVKNRFDQARKEARKADQIIAQHKQTNSNLDDLPKFLGVPFTVKECFALEGMPNSSGLVSRKHVIAEVDATVVARLKAAGAIPLGVTNLSELCMWWESHNSVYGRTKNPYNPTKIVGGSSGGEGAIIGAGCSPFGVGSDIGGSIRMPAFFNGVFGHKPSGGLVPGTGQHPMADGIAAKYLSSGPLCRRAEDLGPLVEIMMGPDSKDHQCIEFPDLRNLVEKKNQVDVKKLKYYWLDGIETWKVSPLCPTMREALHKVVEHFSASHPINVREQKKLTALEHSVEIWSAMIHRGNPTTFKSLMANGRKRFLSVWEFIKWAVVGKSDFTYPALQLCLVEVVPAFTPGHTDKLVRLGEKLKVEFDELVGDDGVLLFPSHPLPAPKHGAPLWMPFNYVYTGIWNVLEAAATQVPLGLNKNNLPVGIQVIAKNGNDHLTIAVAEHLEEIFGGWVPPHSLNPPDQNNSKL